MPWFVCLTLLFSCGGDEASPNKPKVEPTQDTGWLMADFPLAKNVVVIAVDGLSMGAWSEERFPNLATLVHEGRVFPNHVVQSTGVQSQMASLLSGQTALEHGVGSIHDRGRTFLPEGSPSLAEELREKGMHTLASMALPQLGPEVGGMQRGFDAFLSPTVLDRHARTMERVDLVMQQPWADALGGEKPFFALLQLSDFMNGGQKASESVMLTVAAALKKLAPQYPSLAQAAEQVQKGPQDFDEVRRGLMRRRGSVVYMKLLQAIYEGQLADLDALVGRLISDLHSAGRLDDTVIALVSLGGTVLGQPANEGPAFAPEIIRIPLVLWGPGRVVPGQDTSLLGTQHVASRLLQLVQGRAPKTMSNDGRNQTALAFWDARLSRRGAITTNLHMEANGAVGSMAYDRMGRPLLSSDGLQPDMQEQWGVVHDFYASQSKDLGLRLSFDLPAGTEMQVSWRMLEGRYLKAVAAENQTGEVELGRRSAAVGRATLRGKSELHILTHSREQPMVIEWSGAPGNSDLPDHPLLWVLPDGPAGGVETATDPAAEWQAEFVRDAGVWTRAIVQGEKDRDLHMLVALVPEHQNRGAAPAEIEWTTGANDRVEFAPGRRDGALLWSQTPLNVQFKEPPSYGLAVSLGFGASETHWVQPQGMAVAGTALYPGGAGEWFVPDWWPGVTDSLYTEAGWPMAPGVTLHRIHELTGAFKPLSFDAAEFVEHLGQGE